MQRRPISEPSTGSFCGPPLASSGYVLCLRRSATFSAAPSTSVKIRLFAGSGRGIKLQKDGAEAALVQTLPATCGVQLEFCLYFPQATVCRS